MQQITKRLRAGDDFKKEIKKLAKREDITAGVVVSLVGGLERARLRMAGATPDSQNIKEWSEPVEIVAGTGTVSKNGCHVHIVVSSQDGVVFGGHLKEGCIVGLTVELVVLVFDDTTYTRQLDEETGFNELVTK